MRVLVVEDEAYLGESIARGLTKASIAADWVSDGDTAIELLAVNAYDAVVLDRDLPGTSGDGVCLWITSEQPGTRVLMLTAATGLTDRLEGLGIGADDYLTKPFHFSELVARLRALDRRRTDATPPVVEVADLRLDPFRREVFRNGHHVRLSNKEFALLHELLRARGGVLSAEQLLEKVWDMNADPFTNTVRVTMSTLRKRLGEPALIETVPGAGYRVAVGA